MDDYHNYVEHEDAYLFEAEQPLMLTRTMHGATDFSLLSVGQSESDICLNPTLLL